MAEELPHQTEPVKPPEQPTPLEAERHAIVTYWTNALRSPFVSNAKDVATAQKLREIAERMNPVSEDQFLTFASSLATCLDNSITQLDEFDREDLLKGERRFTVGMDFLPDEFLSQAGAGAGLDPYELQTRLPHKTWTYMKPGEVTVYRSAAKREEKIYPPIARLCTIWGKELGMETS